MQMLSLSNISKWYERVEDMHPHKEWSFASRVIALPSVKYNCPVETDVMRLGRGETGREPACRENNN